MKNIQLENGRLTLMHTDVIMAMYESNDKHTYMTIITDMMLYVHMTEDNLCIQNTNLKIINKHLLIPMMEISNSKITDLLMMQIESLRQELTLIKRCMHETVKVHAIKSCSNIPLNSYELQIQSSENNEIIVNNDVTNVFVNSKLRFNPPMTHVLCTNIIFDANCDVEFDWKYLPAKLVSITINNKQMLESFVSNIENMIKIPDEIHVNNYLLKTKDLDILVDTKPDIIMYNNDKLIKYEKIILDFEE